MCGRVTLRRPARVRLERLDTRALVDELPRYNIAPTQRLWVVTEVNEETFPIVAAMGFDSVLEQGANRNYQCAS
jgi:putative SOS response-associated peptidase YedK